MDFEHIDLPGGSLDERQVRREVERASRNQRPLALIAARVEAATAEDLEAATTLLFQQSRDYDGRGRLPEGTLLLLLPEVDLKGGITVAERVRWRARRQAPEMAPRLRLYVTTLSQQTDPADGPAFVRSARDAVELSRRPLEHDRAGLVSWRMHSA